MADKFIARVEDRLATDKQSEAREADEARLAQEANTRGSQQQMQQGFIARHAQRGVTTRNGR